MAQARARKAANLSRQEVLRKERAAALGDPVRGITTPFIKSFDTGVPLPANSEETSQSQSLPDARKEKYLNYSLAPHELEDALARSEALSAPVPSSVQHNPSIHDIDPEAEQKMHAAQHANATEALARIASLANSSSKDRLRANIARCVATFGRHSTDATLPGGRNVAVPIAVSDTPAAQRREPGTLPDTPRAGPDTGSAEVQIAILTAKIRALANELERSGKTDKMNKRNLRLLVHKRQKQLAYLRKKERGGARWQHCIETLGLTEGTWKGEISM
ncbi:MAG: hypothetical protein M1822_007190 [Bathelium mastoideum]|nr:MAG: hypothetical protein M1822_007190 [Bathelium mastoideum]